MNCSSTIYEVADSLLQPVLFSIYPAVMFLGLYFCYKLEILFFDSKVNRKKLYVGVISILLTSPISIWISLEIYKENRSAYNEFINGKNMQISGEFKLKRTGDMNRLNFSVSGVVFEYDKRDGKVGGRDLREQDLIKYNGESVKVTYSEEGEIYQILLCN